MVVYTPTSFAQAGDSPPTHPYAQSRPIPGRYIVVFKNSVANPAAEAASIARANGGQLHHTYTSAIKGFAASLPDAALQGIRHNPNVELVEQDQTVSLQQSSPQDQATWGLDRIDQADRPLDTQYHFTGTGAGVNAFIIDTGIKPNHVEFTGRLLPGYNTVADYNGTADCNGHGTHVAGTVGGTTWGVAKGVSLIPVRVLDCNGSGTWSGVIAGVDWVANSTLRPAVANMSLGGTASASLDAAVAGAVAKGVTVVVAAGNSNLDACTSSPAREPSAITVGATTSADARASYSNYGACVDIFAPGSSITSAWNSTPDSYYTISGTSMASPHVTGAAALALAANPTASPAAVALQLKSGATPNRITSVGTGSPNLLINSLGTGGGGNPAPAPEPVTQTVAFKSMAGSSARTGGNWKASAVVTVRDVNSGATVANATLSGGFSPGGTASCVTGSNGSCTLTSGPLKLKAAQSTVLSGTGISGTLMQYDAAQNSVTQIVISRP
jgi:subtilisin family serine protease